MSILRGAGIIAILTLLLASELLLSATETPMLAVKARTVRQEGHRYQCLVSLTNQTKITLTNIRVTVFTNQHARFNLGPFNLTSGQATVLQQNIDKESYCSGRDLFFRLAYESQGTVSELILDGERNAPSEALMRSILTPLMPWGLGLLSAIIGGWFTHHLSARREREKDRVARSTKLYDVLEPAVREFLLSWGANPVPEMLRSNFYDLQRKATLGSEIVQFYRETYKVLADTGQPLNRKQEAAAELDKRMRTYIQNFYAENAV